MVGTFSNSPEITLNDNWFSMFEIPAKAALYSFLVALTIFDITKWGIPFLQPPKRNIVAPNLWEEKDEPRIRFNLSAPVFDYINSGDVYHSIDDYMPPTEEAAGIMEALVGESPQVEFGSQPEVYNVPQVDAVL